MGRIAAPFGIKGWVKVQTFSEDPGALLEFDSWRIGHEGQQRDYVVLESQDHSNTLVARLEGVDDRDQAYALRGLKSRCRAARYPPRRKMNTSGPI